MAVLCWALELGFPPAFAQGWLCNAAAAWRDRNCSMRKVTVGWSTEFHEKGEQPQFVTAKRMKFFNGNYSD